MDNQEKTTLSIAKIGAIQAIVVALITASAGMAAGYMARGKTDESPIPVQRWVNIEGIKSNFHSRIRLVITVNGINYSYPSKAIWAEVGENRERFPLPQTNESYRISFQAFLANGIGNKTIQAGSQFVDEITIKQLPAKEKSYTLRTVDDLSTVYKTQVEEVSVKYSIE